MAYRPVAQEKRGLSCKISLLYHRLLDTRVDYDIRLNATRACWASVVATMDTASTSLPFDGAGAHVVKRGTYVTPAVHIM